jgi:hypothetical protein
MFRGEQFFASLGVRELSESFLMQRQLVFHW